MSSRSNVPHSSLEEQEYNNNNKRKYDQVSDNDSDDENNKKLKQEEEIIIIGMKTLLEQQPDEIIERILDFIPAKQSILISSTCHQFRRVWKRTNYGIVYNLIIELNLNFIKHSTSLDEKIELFKFAKNAIKGIHNNEQEEREKRLRELKARDDLEKFIEKLEKNESLKSERVTKALSQITRFNYGERAGGTICGFEIEFGEVGMINYWYEDLLGQSTCIMSYSLVNSLELNDEEWDIIIETAADYVGCSVLFIIFELINDVSSIFLNHELLDEIELLSNRKEALKR